MRSGRAHHHPPPCYEGPVSRPGDVPVHFSTFSAHIGKVGSNFCVDVPPAVSRVLGQQGRVPVVGAVNGVVEIRTTLMPRGGGHHRLFLDRAARAAAGVSEGDRVDIALMLDEQPRAETRGKRIVRAVQEALAAREKAADRAESKKR